MKKEKMVAIQKERAVVKYVYELGIYYTNYFEKNRYKSKDYKAKEKEFDVFYDFLYDYFDLEDEDNLSEQYSWLIQFITNINVGINEKEEKYGDFKQCFSSARRDLDNFYKDNI